MGTNVSEERAASIFRYPEDDGSRRWLLTLWWNLRASKYTASLPRTSQCNYSLPKISYNRITFGEFLGLKLCSVWSPEVTVCFYSAAIFPIAVIRFECRASEGFSLRYQAILLK
jgi:hypothetical protein